MKTTKAQKALVNAANLVIHRQNLYSADNRRVVNAHVHDGTVCVQDLYSGARYAIAGNTWRNGAGHVVTFVTECPLCIFQQLNDVRECYSCGHKY